MSLKSNIRDALICSIAPVVDMFHHAGSRIRVISLHDIPARSRNAFEDKMRWLKANYHIVSLEDAYTGTGLTYDRTNVALSFDDGFKEQATFAVPVLQKLSIPAIFFVPSGAIDAGKIFGRENLKRNGTFEFMSISEIKTLAADPLFTIGGHTMHHIDLGRHLSSQELENEIVNDKRCLEEMTEQTIDFFAYPFGSAKNLHPDSIQVIKKAGYKAAFTIVPSFWLPKRDPYHAGRDSLSIDDSVRLWSACLAGGYDALSALKNLSPRQ